MGYAQSDPSLTGLFSGIVAVSEDLTTVKSVTNPNVWGALSEGEQNMVKTNALNALEESYCFDPAHKGNVIPGMGFQFVDNSGNILDWKVTGPGLVCK